ncbi:NUDIX domain-containing protein [Streptomyces sp. SID13666]|nr:MULTISPECIES: NUDIX domain-containing protein [unclassified Streptomyces]MCZ4103114.1 NUDIX domain-containing protein [Streptomyces sp. H39-C1]NEA58861.1 NUDIX domain-containing protein [Streptomyces sp. SID13666]NEA72921.1 NUDIX domain-containing protein [Streptomyces sp. SID13588]
MAITSEHIRATVDAYLDAHPEEKDALSVVLGLLDDGADLSSRQEFRGHATAGAVLVNREGEVLHIHHLALDTWLLPGGHLEPQDTTLHDAALRELTEETGIAMESVTSVGDRPVHIDTHPIPANAAKGEPGHRHIDFRFLFRTAADVRELQAEEVTDFAWRDAPTLADERLRQRVRSGIR